MKGPEVFTPLRKYHVFYEVGSPYAVDGQYAEDLLCEADGVLARTVGASIVAELEPIKPKTLTPAISADRLVLPNRGDHLVLLTRRKFSIAGIPGLNNGFNRPASPTDTVAGVTVLPFEEDPNGAVTVETIVHEDAHGFGLGHCGISGCIMYDTPYEMSPEQKLAGLSDPFCGSCRGQVQRAAVASLPWQR